VLDDEAHGAAPRGADVCGTHEPLLPPAACVLWLVAPTPLVELLELVEGSFDEVAELEVLELPFVWAVDACATPETSPTVSAPAVAAVTAPVIPAVRRSFCPFMA